MILADSTVAQRQALGTTCARGMVCNTHASDFRTTQEAVGTAMASPEAIAVCIKFTHHKIFVFLNVYTTGLVTFGLSLLNVCTKFTEKQAKSKLDFKVQTHQACPKA